MNRCGSVPLFVLMTAMVLLPIVIGCQTEKASPAISLKATGVSSTQEMVRDRALLDSSKLKDNYEMAFRLAFASQPADRNYPESARLIGLVISERPEFAPAYRVVGYALFNMNRGTEALAAYQRAVALDPNYGEAHYALAFLFAMGDREVGRGHYKKAMELGVPDERDLGGQFYPPTPIKDYIH